MPNQIKRPNTELVEFWEQALETDPYHAEQEDLEEWKDRASSWDVCAVAALAPWASAICHHTTELIKEHPCDHKRHAAITNRPQAKAVAAYFDLGCQFELDMGLAVDDPEEGLKQANATWLKILDLAKAEYTDAPTKD